MTDGAIHQMSQMLGELLAGQRALDGKIDDTREEMRANHHNAETHWNDFYEKLREVNHATTNLAMADLGHMNALRSMGEKLQTLETLPEAVAAVDTRVAAVEVVNAQVANLTSRLGAIENMAYRVAGMAAAVSIGCSIVGAVILHYGSNIIHWLTGKT